MIYDESSRLPSPWVGPKVRITFFELFSHTLVLCQLKITIFVVATSVASPALPAIEIVITTSKCQPDTALGWD
jgi:hypothetical protein